MDGVRSACRRSGWLTLSCVLLVWCGVELPACAPRVRTAATAPALPADANALYAALRGREARIHTLRARFTSVYTAGGPAGISRRAAGVLLVSQPDRFRLRLVSPFGVTVLDYLSRSGHTYVVLPLQGRVLVDAAAERGAPFPPALLRQQFLRAGAEFAGRCAPRERTTAVVGIRCRDRAGTLWHDIEVDRRTGQISREVSFDARGGQVIFSVDYADYRRVGDAALPFSIDLRTAARRLQVAVTRYEVNPPLGDALFAVPPGAGR